MEKAYRLSKILLIVGISSFALSYGLKLSSGASDNVFRNDPSLYEGDSLAQFELSMAASYLNPPALADDKFAEFNEQTIDSDGFYLRVDKVNLFKPIVLDVDPRYKDLYVESWKKGISHGKFTATPDKVGITYLYSHAVSNPGRAIDENAWFTYLDKLVDGDEVIIYYRGNKYTYVVNEISAVKPDATGVYTGIAPVSKLRMQFCGPPTGSLAMRTIVDALLVEVVPI